MLFTEMVGCPEGRHFLACELGQWLMPGPFIAEDRYGRGMTVNGRGNPAGWRCFELGSSAVEKSDNRLVDPAKVCALIASST